MLIRVLKHFIGKHTTINLVIVLYELRIFTVCENSKLNMAHRICA